MNASWIDRVNAFVSRMSGRRHTPRRSSRHSGIGTWNEPEALEIRVLLSRPDLRFQYAAEIQLDGSQEAPTPVVTDAFGELEIKSRANGMLAFELEVGRITDVTAAHLHFGAAGVAGPILVGLFAGQTTVPGNDDQRIVAGRITDSDLTGAAGVDTVRELLAAILDGNVYVNVHTLAHAPGEIRGQLSGGQFDLAAEIELDGAQEVSSVVTDAFGEFKLKSKSGGERLTYQLEVGRIHDVTAAHLHHGAIGVNGPILAGLFSGLTSVPGENDKAIASGTLTDADLTGADGVDSVNKLVAEILRGNVYANVHTTAHLPGEIRGQVTDTRIRAEIDLEGSQEVGPVVTDAFGEFDIKSKRDGTLEFELEVGHIADVTAAHLHFGVTGVNGPVLVTLFAGLVSVPGDEDKRIAGGTITDADLTGANGIDSIAELVAAVLSGDVYVNVHTLANPTGELRGQLIDPRLR
jgi:CHRD domain-containing protein